MTAQLEDGRFDAVVLPAEASDRDHALERVVTTGEHRSDAVAIVATKAAVTVGFALLHRPCTLVVNGAPVHGEMS